MFIYTFVYLQKNTYLYIYYPINEDSRVFVEPFLDVLDKRVSVCFIADCSCEFGFDFLSTTFFMPSSS